jgi:hypothetical protein
MLARVVRFVGSVAAILVLGSCIPQYDVSLFNDTGSDIIAIMPGGRPEQFRIPLGASAPVGILFAHAGQPEQFIVVGGSHRWHYSRYMDTFGIPRYALREHRSFGAVRIHARVDSRGRVYLLSPTDSPVAQPTGFPIHPDWHQNI